MFLLYFIGFHALLILSESAYVKRLHNKKDRVVITDKRAADFLNYFIEYIVLSRYSFCGYKNNIKGNLRILSAISLTIFLGALVDFICNLFGITFSLVKLNTGYINLEFSLLVTGFGLCISTFILERSHLHKKWEFLAQLQNKVFETDLGIKRDILNATLTLHLIEMEMWSHKSFRDRFISAFALANSTAKGEYPFKINSLKYAEDDVLKTTFTKKEALGSVMAYQNILLNRQKFDKTFQELQAS